MNKPKLFEKYPLGQYRPTDRPTDRLSSFRNQVQDPVRFTQGHIGVHSTCWKNTKWGAVEPAPSAGAEK